MTRGFAYRTGYEFRATQFGAFGRPDFVAFDAERQQHGDRLNFEVAEPFLTDLQRDVGPPDRHVGRPAGRPQGGLVLNDADHMTFGGQTGRAVGILPREDRTRQLQPKHHALVAAVSTDWWRAQLLGDAAAAARLLNPAGLAPDDRWRTG